MICRHVPFFLSIDPPQHGWLELCLQRQTRICIAKKVIWLRRLLPVADAAATVARAPPCCGQVNASISVSLSLSLSLSLSRPLSAKTFTRAGDLCFWPFLRSPARAPTIKTLRGTVAIVGSPYGGDLFPLRTHRCPFFGDPFRLRASFNYLIVGRGPGAFNSQGSGEESRTQACLTFPLFLFPLNPFLGFPLFSFGCGGLFRIYPEGLRHTN